MHCENLAVNHQNIFSSKLPGSAKALYCVLKSLASNVQGYCYAYNEYLQQSLNLSVRQIRRLLAKLEELGFISRFIEKGKNGNGPYDQRKIYVHKSAPMAPKVSKYGTPPRTYTPSSEDIDTPQISKEERKDDSIDKKEPEIVHNLPNPEPVEVLQQPVATLKEPESITPAAGSMPFRRKREAKPINLEDPEVLELLSLEDQYKPFIRTQIVSGWISKYGATIVLACMIKLLKTQKNSILSDSNRRAEKWMEVCMKTEKNRQIALNAQKVIGSKLLTVKDRYCRLNSTGKDLQFKGIENDRFTEIMREWCESHCKRRN